MTQAIYIIFLLSSLIQIGYWLGLFRKGISSSRLRKKKHDFPFVSVIICVKNEGSNLRKHLQKILEQDYPNFEVLVVNDHSTDDTLAVLAEKRKQYTLLRVIEMKDHEEYVGKKMALTQGIKSAKGDWVLLTDADCAPVSDKWIREMMATSEADKQIGLGYSPYLYRSGLLNAFVRYETLLTALQYISHARIQHPYMGVGRNLLYKKELFLKADGFEKHKNIASGDDDLFISEVATGQNTYIVDSYDSVVYSEPQTTWKSWLHQKKRHMSTGTHYNFFTTVLLGLFSFSHFFSIFSFIFLLFLDFGTDVALGVYILRTLLIVLMCINFRKKFHEVNDWYWIPFLDFLYPFYYMVFAPYLISTKTQQQSWKQQQQHHE